MGKKITSVLTFFFITAALSYILLNPYATAYYAQSAIKMCASSLVPTLFVFMVFSRMLSHLCTAGFLKGKAVDFLSRLFNLPPCLIPICISGLFCGAPSGAFAICRLYEKGFCTKSQALKACILANNCSAAFILGFVSSLLDSKGACFYIFISNIATTLTVYMIFFRSSKENDAFIAVNGYEKENISEILTESISSSVTATVTLCGYVIFFYTFTQLMCDRLTPFFASTPALQEHSDFLNAAISSFFEISSGVLRIDNLYGTEAVVLCAGAVAFTGLSMIFQVSGILLKSKISSRSFFFSKCICAFVSPIFVIILMLLSPSAISVSGAGLQKNHAGVTFGDLISLSFVTVIAFAGAYLLYCLDKKHKK